MPRKRNRKTKGSSRPGLKSARQDNLHPVSRPKTSLLNVYLNTAQIAEMKQLAREHGTTLAQEFDHAVDAYLLGMSQGQLRMLHTVLHRFNESLDRSNQAIEAALRKTEKNLSHLARKKRSGQKRK